VADSSADHSIEQQTVAEFVEDKNNDSQVPNNNHIQCPAVGQLKVGQRGTSPTVTGKDESRSVIGKYIVRSHIYIANLHFYTPDNSLLTIIYA